jgi:hypothetical protein
VLAHAATKAAVVSSLVIGGVVVGKKLALVAAALVLVFAAWWAKRSFSVITNEPAIPTLAHDVTTPNELRASTSLGVVESTPAPAQDELRAPIAAAPSAKLVPLRGRVIDGETGAAIAGAHLQLFAPRKTKLSDLAARWSDRVVEQQDGTLWTEDTWPWIPEPLSDLARADQAEFTVYDPPLPGAQAIAEGTSDGDGTFAFTVPESWGFLECRADGFGSRELPARRAERKMVNEDGQSKPEIVDHDSLVVRMWRERTLSGYVIDTQGERLRRRMRLCFSGGWNAKDARGSKAFDPQNIGSWIVETDDAGGFELRAAASFVRARSLETGWRLTDEGIHPEKKERWSFATSFTPGATEPAILVAERSLVLTVRDAMSGDPIEAGYFDCRETNGYPRRSGKFHAPRGRLVLTPSFQSFGSHSFKEWSKYALHVTVWAEGHASAIIDIADALEGPDVEVRLPRGELPIVYGTVRASGNVVAGAEISILAYYRIAWREDASDLIDSATTAKDGSFRFRLPTGEYLLRCKSAGSVRCSTFVAPTSGPLVIDLDRTATVRVEVRDADGSPRAGHVVALQGSEGRAASAKTDATGSTTFADLAPGEYTAFIEFKGNRWSFHADAMEKFAVLEGQRRTVVFTLPRADPRHARLLLDDGSSCDGWQAHAPFGSEEKWVAVQPDGTIPIDIQIGVSSLEVQRPDTPRWTFQIPKDPPDGFPLRITRQPRGFTGLLRNWSDNQPLWNVGVLATRFIATGEKELRSCVACATNPDGRFELLGLEDAHYEITFRFMYDRLVWDNSLGEVSFTPSRSPTNPPTELEIRLPRASATGSFDLPMITFSGKLRVADQPAKGISITIWSLVDEPNGVLRLLPQSCYGRGDSNGDYRVIVPRVARYRATFYDAEARREFAAREWTSASDDAAQTIDFDLK